mgnify:CR=1 FL=1
MAERHLIIDHLKLSYEGLLNVAELYALISSWFYEKGWDWYEKLNDEQVTPEGKQIHIVMEPYRNITDYYRLDIAITLNGANVQDVTVEHAGKKLQLQQGSLHMTFDGYVVSDRKGKWESKPFLWFLGMVLEKYFYREHFAKAEKWLKDDVEDLHARIKKFLNTFHYTYRT